MTYYRPLFQLGQSRPRSYLTLGDQSHWFSHVEVLQRGRKSYFAPIDCLPKNITEEITKIKKNSIFESFQRPKVVGILNVTPDSFSDGGKFLEPNQAVIFASQMRKDGADLIDIGGESTRPGSVTVDYKQELMRLQPVLNELLDHIDGDRISIDTRKSEVMDKVTELGVKFINDVSALTFDHYAPEIIKKKELVVCLMHGGLNPKNMQDDPVYEDVVLDVYDYLKKRIEILVQQGISKRNIVIDPGIGFGKTTDHNLHLIRNASLFHCLGVPIMFGVSRKRFIGQIGRADKPEERFPGSMAVAQELMNQGIQMIRVHDVKETRQALDLWEALTN